MVTTDNPNAYWRQYLTAGYAEFTTPSIAQARYHRTYRIRRWPNRPDGELLLDVRTDVNGEALRWCNIGRIHNGGYMFAPPEQQPSAGAAEYVRRLIERQDPRTDRHPASYIRILNLRIDKDSDLFQTIDALIFDVIDEKPINLTPSSNCAACGKSLIDPTSVKVGIGPDCRKRLGISAKQITKFLGQKDAPR